MQNSFKQLIDLVFLNIRLHKYVYELFAKVKILDETINVASISHIWKTNIIITFEHYYFAEV